jgi:hypothetical protein
MPAVARVLRQFVSSQTHVARMLRYARPKHIAENFGGSRIIDRHYECISAASRQLFLNSLKSSVITEKAKKICRIHDARPAIAKRRNTK